jgi:glucosyl-dolichyl phosphate glucuronosyltransferase
MRYPSISVIIPTGFREQLLLECIDSIIFQEYPDFEIIVIDQAEQPVLQQTLNSRYTQDGRIRYIHAVQVGASRARNLGISRAAGAIVAFIDDDARADTSWLQAIGETFSLEPKPALMAGRILPHWDAQKPEWFPAEREFLLGLYDIGGERRELPVGDMPIGANMAGLRDVVIAHGGIEERLGPNHFHNRNILPGEEAILGRRIRDAGYLSVYEPRALVWHHIAAYKLRRPYFLRRHFWEGVAVAVQMRLLGQIGESPWPHYGYHCREMCLAAARFALPSYRHTYSYPVSAIRMLALSRLAYSVGVTCGIARRLPGELANPDAVSVSAPPPRFEGGIASPVWLPSGHRLQERAMPEVRAQFTESRPDLDDVRSYNRQMLDIFATLRPLADTVLLDVGASPHGFALEHALELGVVEYCGIGLGCSTEVLVRSGKGVGALLKMNADDLHLPSNTFDRIITLSTFEHFFHPNRVLREMYRVLKPGGAVLVNFQPIWTSVQGHHLHHVPDVSSLLPPWSHLRWNKEQMSAELGPIWPATASMTLDQVVAWIYKSDEINRLPADALRKAFYDSPFRIEWLTPLEDEWSEAQAATAEEIVASLPWSLSDLRTKGYSALLVKPS